MYAFVTVSAAPIGLHLPAVFLSYHKVFIISSSLQKEPPHGPSLPGPRSGFPFLSVLRFFPDAEQPPEQASQALGAFENDHLHRADHLSSLDTPL
jgi:hypothetical protein